MGERGAWVYHGPVHHLLKPRPCVLRIEQRLGRVSAKFARVRTHCSQHGCDASGHCDRCVVDPERVDAGPGLPFPIRTTPRIVRRVREFRPIKVCHSKAREDSWEGVGIVRVVGLQGPIEPVDWRQCSVDVAGDYEGGVVLGRCVD